MNAHGRKSFCHHFLVIKSQFWQVVHRKPSTFTGQEIRPWPGVDNVTNGVESYRNCFPGKPTLVLAPEACQFKKFICVHGSICFISPRIAKRFKLLKEETLYTRALFRDSCSRLIQAFAFLYITPRQAPLEKDLISDQQ